VDIRGVKRVTTKRFFTTARSDWLNLDSGTQSLPGTVPDAVLGMDLVDAATQGTVATFAIPSDAVPGQPLLASPYWIASANDATPHTVRWSADCLILAAGSSAIVAGTTVAYTGDSAARTINVLVTETAVQWLAAVNPADVIRADIRRVGADAADTYSGTVRLVGVMLTYTAFV
jgi:hypothetical protein